MSTVDILKLLRDIMVVGGGIVDILVSRDSKSAKEILGDIPASKIAQAAERIKARQKFGK